MTELEPSTVALWLTTLESISEDVQLEIWSWLNQEERDRWQRQASLGRRQRFLLARALVRSTLAYYTGIAPAAVQLSRTPLGKPALTPGQCRWPLQFNLTHTQGLIALAVGHGSELGIDAEWLHREAPLLRLAERFFAPTEYHALRASPRAERSWQFFTYWTLKEAYLKGRGEGLRVELASLVFTWWRDEVLGLEDARNPDQAVAWRFRLFNPTLAHRLALAVAPGGPEPLQVQWHWTTLDPFNLA